MASVEVDLIVEAISKGFDKVADDINKTDKAVGKSGDSAKKAGFSWTELKSGLDLAGQAYNKIAAAAEFAYTNIKEGAQLELARNQFDNLAQSIDTTADSLLTKMRAATNGMQSDAELIAGATDLINLGLAGTEEETVRLATAVGTLGLDMQQVVLTFANNSKARLDALGLSVEEVTKRAEELNAEGFDGDAFDEAVLEGLEAKMELLGDASETTAGQLQQLEADWANLTNEMKQAAAVAAAPIIGGISGDIQTQKQLTAAYEEGIITYKKWLEVSRISRGAGGLTADQMRQLGIDVDATGQIFDATAAATERLANRLDELGVETENLTEAQITQAARSAEMSAFYQAQAEAADGLSASQLALYDHLKLTSEGAGELSGAQSMLYGEMEAATYSTYAWKQAHESATGAISQEIAEVETLSGRLSELPVSLTTEWDFRAFGIDTLEKANQLLNSLQNPMGPGADPYGGQDPYNPASTDRGDAYDGISGNAIDQGAGSSYGPSSSVGGGGQTNQNFASGTDGWMTVPPGFPNDSYKVGLTSGEKINVVPNGGGSGGGQPVTINVYQRPGENGRNFADRVATMVNETNGRLR